MDDHLEHARGPLGSVLKNLLQKLYYKDNGRIILRSLHNSPSLTYPCFLRDQISFSFSFTHCAAYTASTGPKPGANAGHETLQTRKQEKARNDWIYMQPIQHNQPYLGAVPWERFWYGISCTHQGQEIYPSCPNFYSFTYLSHDILPLPVDISQLSD